LAAALMRWKLSCTARICSAESASGSRNSSTFAGAGEMIEVRARATHAPAGVGRRLVQGVSPLISPRAWWMTRRSVYRRVRHGRPQSGKGPSRCSPMIGVAASGFGEGIIKRRARSSARHHLGRSLRSSRRAALCSQAGIQRCLQPGIDLDSRSR
jgi:hypothetical protein